MQGDPAGTAQSVLPLGNARNKATEAFTTSTSNTRHSGACDQWFIDDGQAFVLPHLADSWLRAVDAALLEIGATRGEGSGVKSRARLLCPVDARQLFDGWDAAYIRNTCQVDGTFDPVEILGASIGNDTQINDHAAKLISKTIELHGKVNSIDHAATEMVLTRQCANVSKLVYAMRTQGDRRADSHNFDTSLRRAVECSLGGTLPDISWWQAEIAVSKGGLGMRSTSTCLLPAFLASRITSRTAVGIMAGQMQDSGVGSKKFIMQDYDDRTNQALERFLAQLPPELHSGVREFVQDCYNDIEKQWSSIMNPQQDEVGRERNG